MQVVLDEHNRYRAKHGVPALVWDATVAANAQNFANGCPGGHSQGSGYGENMAWGHQDFASAVKNWYDEVQLYVPGSGFSSGTGHFTQIVWRDTAKLGCGMNAVCGMATYVCQYDPPGEQQYRSRYCMYCYELYCRPVHYRRQNIDRSPYWSSKELTLAIKM
jgi:hypothetical protein